MKIYKIEHDEFGYDIYFAHIIVANSKFEVVLMAKNKAAEEGAKIWDTAKIEECGEYTGAMTEPFILLSDFNAG